MEYQNDMQNIIDLINDYTSKHNISDNDKKEAINSIYKLIPTNTQAAPTNTNKTNTSNKKAQSKTQAKTDIYDLWTGLIKNGMTEI